MALSQVNAPIRRPEKESILDKIFKTMKIANMAVGAGLAIPQWLAGKDAAAADAARKQQELNLSKITARTAQMKGTEQVQPDVERSLVPPTETKIERGETGGIPGADITTNETFADKLVPPKGAFPSVNPITGRAIFLRPTAESGIPTSNFKAEYRAAVNAFNNGNVFVNRDNKLIEVEPGQEKEGEVPIGDIHKWSQAWKNIDRDIKERGAIRSEGALTHTVTKAQTELFNKTFSDVQTAWDTERKAVAEFKDQLEEGQEMIRNINRVEAGAVGAIMARARNKEVGMLTDQDYARAMPGSAPQMFKEAVRWLRGGAENTIPPEIVSAIEEGINRSMALLRRKLAVNTFNRLAEKAAAFPDFFEDERVKRWEKIVRSQVPGFDRAKKMSRLIMVMDASEDPNVDAEAQAKIDELERGW